MSQAAKYDRKAAAEAMRNDPTHEKHGTNAGYKYYGCRCGRCTEARAAKQRTQKGFSTPPSVTLAERYPVKSSDPDPALWHWTGQEWLPRWGEEMLGSEF